MLGLYPKKSKTAKVIRKKITENIEKKIMTEKLRNKGRLICHCHCLFYFLTYEAYILSVVLSHDSLYPLCEVGDLGVHPRVRPQGALLAPGDDAALERPLAVALWVVGTVVVKVAAAHQGAARVALCRNCLNLYAMEGKYFFFSPGMRLAHLESLPRRSWSLSSWDSIPRSRRLPGNLLWKMEMELTKEVCLNKNTPTFIRHNM